MKPELSLIEKAARIAIITHINQKRKDDDFPVIIHPFMVAVKLAKNGFNDVAIASALVHDILEDTKFSKEELRKELGEEVVKTVEIITEDMSIPWEDRKQKYVQAVKNGSDIAKAVSVVDKIHNMENLLFTYDRIGSDLWKKFDRGREKKIWFEEEMLKVFKETWSHPLIDEYEKLVGRMRNLE